MALHQFHIQFYAILLVPRKILFLTEHICSGGGDISAMIYKAQMKLYL